MRYPPGQGGQQLRMPDGTAVIITEEAGSMTHVIVRNYARAVRLFAIVDALIIILYVVSGFYYAAVALLGPVCGYHGAKNYVRAHALTYVVFCFVNLCWRTAVFIMASTVAAQVLGFLMVLVEVYITRLAIQFYKFIKEFTGGPPDAPADGRRAGARGVLVTRTNVFIEIGGERTFRVFGVCVYRRRAETRASSPRSNTFSSRNVFFRPRGGRGRRKGKSVFPGVTDRVRAQMRPPAIDVRPRHFLFRGNQRVSVSRLPTTPRSAPQPPAFYTP